MSNNFTLLVALWSVLGFFYSVIRMFLEWEDKYD